MEIGGGQIDDNFPSRDAESLGLQGGDKAEQALLDGGVRQSDEVDADPAADLDLYQNGHRFDADALGRMYIDEHNSII